MFKRSFLIISILIMLNISLFGGHTLYVQSTTQVGPGIVHKFIHAPTAPWIINVLEIDLKNPYVYLESVKAKDLLHGMEATSNMAARNDTPGHRVIGAVNADFYDMSTGIPIGTQMIGGEVVKTATDWQAIGFNINNRPFIANTLYSGSLNTRLGDYTIHGINKSREENQLILFNHYYGSSTGTNVWGTEVIIHPITPWYANDTVVCVIDTIISNQGSSRLPIGRAVLSGHGNSETTLKQFQIQDTVKLYIGLSTYLPQITDVVGGNLKILSNGIYTGSTNTDLHPRTIAGFSADSSVLYLASIDGRQSGSIGMNYRQLADLMIFLGAYHAINLDGGGSTTMMVRNKIANSLFADERSVANALMVISTAPDSGSASSIQISPDNFRIFWGSSTKFNVSGWDQYFNPTEINQENFLFSCDESIGTIDQDGFFRAKNEVDSGYVYVNYNQMSDSAYIYIKQAKKIEINPKNVVTNNIRKIQYLTTVYDIDNLTPNVSNSQFEWSILNPEVGSIDSVGTFTGISNGISKIVATYRGLSDTANIIVEIGTGRAIIDSLNTTSGWFLNGEYFNPSNTSISSALVGENNRTSLGLSYEFVRRSDARSWIFLNTDIPIYSLPDSIYIDIKSNPGGHKPHMVNIVIGDDNDELYQKSSLIYDSTFTSYGFALSDFAQIEPGSNFYFPVSIKTIQIRLGYEGDVGDTNRGVIYFDNLQASYPTFTKIENKNISNFPQSFYLYQNYPNPFNATTKFRFKIPTSEFIELNIYNILGEKVDSVVSQNLAAGQYEYEFNGNHLSTGIYFYQIEAGTFHQTRKFILLK